jgi:hypothetical protein
VMPLQGGARDSGEAGGGETHQRGLTGKHGPQHMQAGVNDGYLQLGDARLPAGYLCAGVSQGEAFPPEARFAAEFQAQAQHPTVWQFGAAVHTAAGVEHQQQYQQQYRHMGATGKGFHSSPSAQRGPPCP